MYRFVVVLFCLGWMVSCGGGDPKTTQNDTPKSPNTIDRSKASDEYLHLNPPPYFDSGLKIQTYKNFRIFKTSNYHTESVSFWNETENLYTKKIEIDSINPYRDLQKNSLPTPRGSLFSFHSFFPEDLASCQKKLSKEYPASYTKDQKVVAAKLVVLHNYIYYKFNSSHLPIVIQLELFNASGETIGIESTLFVFDQDGKYKSYKFNTPLYTLVISDDGNFISYAIGGEYGGERLAAIYPYSFRVYNLENKSFLYTDNIFHGELIGSGYFDGFFLFTYDLGNKLDFYVIEPKYNKLYEKLSVNKENKYYLFVNGKYYVEGRLKFDIYKDFNLKQIKN